MKINILVLTKSTILAHLFDIFSHYFSDYEFFSIDDPELASTMFDNGNFEMVIVDPLNTTDHSIDNEIKIFVDQIKRKTNIKVVALLSCDIPISFQNMFNSTINLPFNTNQILGFLNKNFKTTQVKI